MPAEKIKYDKDFTPIPVDENDEIFANGIFLFNITKMLEFIREHPEKFAPERIEVKDYHREFSTINETHLDTVKISKPVIPAEISPGKYNLIDGNHRMDLFRLLLHDHPEWRPLIPDILSVSRVSGEYSGRHSRRFS